MGIIEIWMPELMVVIFLALPLFRPFFKVLWALDGLVWLPVVALGIIIGIFPAYGFRPECIPLLVFTVIFNIANLPSFSASVASHSNDSFRDRGPLLTVFALILLGASAVPMFAFSSPVYEKPDNETDVKVIKISNRIMNSAGVFNREYSLMVFGGSEPAVQATTTLSEASGRTGRPLIFIVPPELGSVDSIRLVCEELQKKNFTVVTYSYEDNHIVQKKAAFPPRSLMYWQVLRKGTDSASANEKGKTFEKEQRAEIEFLMSRLSVALDIPKGANVPVLLAGYGAGGSALAYLAGEDSFAAQYSNVLGVAAIESYLWSSYLPESGNSNTKAYGGVASRQRTGIANGIKNILPKKVSRTGTLPAAGLPVLYLISGRALNIPKGQQPYQAVFSSVRSGSGPVALTAIEGAGLLDYQDYPFTHPIYSFLLPGLKGAEKSEYPISDTASIIGNFMSLLLASSAKLDTEEIEPTEAVPPKEPMYIPPRYAINGSLYIESKNFPGFGL